MRTEINVMSTLAEMEQFRISHQNERQHPADWCMRCMQAIVAKKAGYKSRNDWTEILAVEPVEDERDAEIAALEAKVQRLESLLRKQCQIAGQTERDLTYIAMKKNEGSRDNDESA